MLHFGPFTSRVLVLSAQRARARPLASGVIGSETPEVVGMGPLHLPAPTARHESLAGTTPGGSMFTTTPGAIAHHCPHVLCSGRPHRRGGVSGSHCAGDGLGTRGIRRNSGVRRRNSPCAPSPHHTAGRKQQTAQTWRLASSRSRSFIGHGPDDASSGPTPRTRLVGHHDEPLTVIQAKRCDSDLPQW
jgi:hypothetical protein